MDGSSGYYANRAASGHGGFVNDVQGVVASCKENTVCKWGSIATATYTGTRLAAAAYAWLAGAVAAGGGLTDRIADALENAGPEMSGRINAVLNEIPTDLKALMTTNSETGAVTIRGGAGNRLREIILNTDGTSLVRAFNATKNVWNTVRSIQPPQ